MAKLLYIMIGMPSAYNSGIELCHRLAEGGFNVTMACNKDISSLSTEDHIHFIWLRADHDMQISASEYRDSISSSFKTVKRLKMFIKMRKLRHQSINSIEIDQLITQVEPDLLVIDIECHKAIIQSRNADIPTILCSRWFSILKQSNNPPLHSTLIPQDSALSRLHSWLQWSYLLFEKRLLRLRQRFSLMRFRPITYRNVVHADLKQLAEHNNLDPNLLFDSNGWLIPHHYKNLPIISLVPQELDFYNLTPNNAYLGPIVPKRNHTFEIASTDLQIIESFILLSRKAQRSIIYFSLGTYLKADTKLMEILNRIVATRSDIALIVGLGGIPLPFDHKIDHENVLYLESAPQIDILKIADIAVLHSGIGSLTEALLHAVPSIVFSVNTNDQNGCAARIKYHDLGYVLDIKTINRHLLETNIDALLVDSTLKKKLIDFSILLQKYQKSEETLERFLSVCPSNIAQQVLQTNTVETNCEYSH